MTTASIDRSYLEAKLQEIQPHSRLRPGLECLLQEINRRELQEECVHRECVSALEEAFAGDIDFIQHLREVW